MKALIKAIILIVVITIIVFFSYFNNTKIGQIMTRMLL